MFNGSDLKRKKRSVDLISKSKMLETFEQFTVRMKKKDCFYFSKEKSRSQQFDSTLPCINAFSFLLLYPL